MEFCYLWSPGVLWLHVVSDSLIALAYATIPVTLVYFVRNRSDLPFNWMFLCFGMFILACGATTRHGGVDALARHLLAVGCRQSRHRCGLCEHSHPACPVGALGARAAQP